MPEIPMRRKRQPRPQCLPTEECAYTVFSLDQSDTDQAENVPLPRSAIASKTARQSHPDNTRPDHPGQGRNSTQDDDQDRASSDSYDAILYNVEYVLMSSPESTIAGVAMHISPSSLAPSSLNSGPASTTNVVPASSRQNSLPL